MRIPRTIVAFALVLLLPALALAQTSSDQQVASLIAEITQLQQQITALGNGSANTNNSTVSPAPAPAYNLPSCPTLYRSLSIGASGDDVAQLQTWLASQGSFTGTATGYFGAITAAAVGRLQVSAGLLQSGDPSLGVVGTRTRALIRQYCQSPNAGQTQSATQSNQCLPVKPPAQECPTNWKPVADQYGCTQYYQCVVSLPSAPSTATSSSPTPAACVNAQKPTCSGDVVPFQTNANGCITAYECVL